MPAMNKSQSVKQESGNSSISNHSTWILDSGATDHICFNLAYYASYHRVKPIHVKLPNGNVVLACHSGSIQLSSTFILHDVLHIPNFSYNLISVHKLASAMNC